MTHTELPAEVVEAGLTAFRATLAAQNIDSSADWSEEVAAVVAAAELTIRAQAVRDAAADMAKLADAMTRNGQRDGHVINRMAVLLERRADRLEQGVSR